MHLDAGEVDLTSHTHVPTVSVQSYVQSDDLCNCMGYAAAVSSQWSSVTGKNNCIGSLSYDSCAPISFEGNLLLWLSRNFWMNR